jgi:HSP20 family protein
MLPGIRRRSGGMIPSILDEWLPVLEDVSRFADTAVRSGLDFNAIPAEVVEYLDRYVVRLEVPGISKEEIEVSMEGNTLSVKVNRPQFAEQEGSRLLHSNRWYGSTTRAFGLPFACGSEEVDASLKDGILSLDVRKQPEKQTKKIAVH